MYYGYFSDKCKHRKQTEMSEEIERKNIDWDEHAEYWDTFPDGQLYTKKTFGLLSERINFDNLTILDFGSGTGLLTEKIALKAKQVVAIDPSEKMIEVLANKKLKNVVTINDSLSKATIASNPVLQNKFDLIVASSVCDFLPNYGEVLTIIKSLLSPKGIFVQWDWLRTEDDTDFGFTEEMIREHYDAVGLKTESVSIPFFIIENGEKMEVIMAVGKLL